MSDAKSAEDRQRRNMPASLGGGAEPAAAPDPPADLSDVLRGQWVGLWSSPVAALMDPVSDLPAVVRLFELYELADRVQAQLAAAAEVDSGLVGARVRLASEIRLAEGQLGLSPRARLALGVALVAGQKAASLDDLADDADE
ncbi:MAG TPA: hypothetical protein VFG33_00070 [Kribbella sp.]|uniref:hypothetical protein n=1 Tax=Kribbella sp. TaxID=1871183 RepID=UPI002D781174|nr:hypothetical protein [Kribbella sp.]HET6291725.1 hypothetical protein [Kribbella sp.]